MVGRRFIFSFSRSPLQSHSQHTTLSTSIKYEWPDLIHSSLGALNIQPRQGHPSKIWLQAFLLFLTMLILILQCWFGQDMPNNMWYLVTTVGPILTFKIHDTG